MRMCAYLMRVSGSSKTTPSMPQNAQQCPKFQNFPGGACPPTLLYSRFEACPPLAGWSTPIHVTYPFNNLRTGLLDTNAF